MRKLVLIALITLCNLDVARAADPIPDYTHATVQQLVDALVYVDAQTIGLHGTLFVSGFIAEDTPNQLYGGVFGSAAPVRFPQMVELVRRGVESLPLLINHLGDKRSTKLDLGNDPGNHRFFTFEYFSDEYDPKVRPILRPGAISGAARLARFASFDEETKDEFAHSFRGEYTVRVGDVCYALVGQIVNRWLLAVRYQPTAITVINSPIESPALIDAVKRDWGGIDSRGLMESLLTDVRASDSPLLYGPALQRLRFYFPDEYHRESAGELQAKISAFEASERK